MPRRQKNAGINASRVLLVACWMTIPGDEHGWKKARPRSSAKESNAERLMIPDAPRNYRETFDEHLYALFLLMSVLILTLPCRIERTSPVNRSDGTNKEPTFYFYLSFHVRMWIYLYIIRFSIRNFDLEYKNDDIMFDVQRSLFSKWNRVLRREGMQ